MRPAALILAALVLGASSAPAAAAVAEGPHVAPPAPRAATAAFEAGADALLTPALTLPLGAAPAPMLLPQMRQQAEAGERCARAAVGYLLASGIGTPAAPEEGRAELVAAARAGCARAHYLLALLDEGAATPEQRERAWAALRAGAARGDGHALNHLGTLHEIERELAEARALYRRALAAGNRAAGLNLARLQRLEALPPEREPIAALERRARAGDGEAQYRLARRIHRGDGALIDCVAAWRWYGESARRGFEAAREMMALLLAQPRRKDGRVTDIWFAKLSLIDVPSDPLLRQRGLRQPIADEDPFYDMR